jgi:hypothetical protein
MLTDPIVEQLHKQREEYMERFQYDFDAIIRDIRAHEAASTAPLVEPAAAKPSNSVARRTRFGRP